MSNPKELEESLREAACNGNEDLVKQLLISGVDSNAKNALNGWTALHWAAKRGHISIASILLQNGADKNVTNDKNERPADVAASKEMAVSLGGIPQEFHPAEGNDVSFVPNYLSHPPFPYLKEGHHSSTHQSQETARKPFPPASINHHSEQELVLKVRVANASERDFIEIELPCNRLTFENLFSTMCQELQVQRSLVTKVRKLPDTILRKDKDVQRLGNFQELEVVLSNKYISESSRNYKPAVEPRSESIVY